MLNSLNWEYEEFTPHVSVLVQPSLGLIHKVFFFEDTFYRSTETVGSSEDPILYGPFDSPVDAVYGIVQI